MVYNYKTMVKFKIDQQIDFNTAVFFLGKKKHGVTCGRDACVWAYHPPLRDLTKENLQEIYNYVNKYYKENISMLKKVQSKFQRQWEKVENLFIKETVKLFDGFRFPDGKYIGYISIFNCNPRSLKDKTFQVFYEEESCVRLTSHELMHFIFYSYTKSKLTDLVKGLDTNKGLWWDVAEVFNNVILSLDKFKKVLQTDGDKRYPAHRRYMSKADELYKDSKNIEDYIKKLFQLIKSKE